MINVVYIAALAMVASFVGTVSSFGVGTILTPVLVLFLPVTQTIFLVGIIHWVNDTNKIFLFHGKINWRLCVLFGIPAVIMSFLGALLVAQEIQGLQQFLGLVIIVYALVLIMRPSFKVPATAPIALFGGAVSGFLAGFLGLRGAIKGVFLSAFNLPKEVYLTTMGLISIFIDTTRVVTYWAGGVVLDPKLYSGLFIFIPASFLGAYSGYRLVYVIPQKQFRGVVAVFMVLAGIMLLIYPISLR
jgi:uncharacterized membrane protein YfcA